MTTAVPCGFSPARKLPALIWPQVVQALSPVKCAHSGSHIAVLSICVAEIGKTSSFPPGKANSLLCCKFTLCTLKSITILTMMIFEKNYWKIFGNFTHVKPWTDILFNLQQHRDKRLPLRSTGLLSAPGHSLHCSSVSEVYGHLPQLASEKSNSLVQSKPLNCSFGLCLAQCRM